jgi:pyruvate/2-oxoglutarate dehydrogenase complex dihydrolipoamide acyltransferase (E2) component
MRSAVVMPDLAAPQPLLSAWFAETGERVYAGDRLVEVLIGGATIDIAAPSSGVLAEKLAWPDDVLAAGQVLGFIDEEDAEENLAS